MQAFRKLAERTGLEPATPGVTGRYSNQLNYHSENLATVYILLKTASCGFYSKQPRFVDNLRNCLHNRQSKFVEFCALQSPANTSPGCR